MKHYLVVANRTVGGQKLADHLQGIIDAEPDADFFVLVPVEPSPVLEWPEFGVPIAVPEVEEALQHEGAQRLRTLLDWLTDAGVKARGAVGPSQPLLAIDRVVRDRPVDEVIVSSLPLSVSRWLRMDLPHRARRRFGLPVTTIQNDSDRLDALPPARRSASAPQAASVAAESVPVAADHPIEVLHIADGRPETERTAAVLAQTRVPCSVHVVPDVAEAAKFLRGEGRYGDQPTPDLVLLELEPAVTRATELLEAVAPDFDMQRTAVVVLTASPDIAGWREAHRMGAFAYVHTPDTIEELAPLLDTVVYEFATLGVVNDVMP